MLRQPAYELLLALLAIALITAGYVVLAEEAVPQPYSVVGYSLGIAGFLLMLLTEVLYSLRKRLSGFHYGPMSLWLQAHVFTGLVGPYLVLLHSGWRFNGLAGVLTLITGVVVVSGLIGRYIYTAVPRDLEGTELALAVLEDRMSEADQRLQAHGIEHLDPMVRALVTALPCSGWWLVIGRPFIRRRQKRQLRQAIARLDGEARAKAMELEGMLLERQRLLREIHSLDMARRLLALWHAFHVPVSAAMFLLAFVHIAGALYYAAFLG